MVGCETDALNIEAKGFVITGFLLEFTFWGDGLLRFSVD